MRDITFTSQDLDRLEPKVRERVLRLSRELAKERDSKLARVPEPPPKDPFSVSHRVTALDKERMARQQYDRSGRRAPMFYNSKERSP